MEAYFTSESLKQTQELAASLTPLLRPGDTLVLTGAMGAGKTHFVQALLAPICPGQLVQSPTFSLVNIYQAPQFSVFHVDFYRLNSEAELWAAGWEDYLDTTGLLLIEWGLRFPTALPLDYLQIELVATGESSRRLLLSPLGARGEQLKEEWLNAVASN